jgi:protein O-mannosyl-transferase
VRRVDRDTSMLPVAGAIAVAAIIAYARSFAGEWISDDVEMIAENSLLRSLAPANLGALASARTDGVNYIPLTFFSLALDYQLWGLQPFGFHVTNLILHIANAILVYLLLVRLQESHGLAASASLLWALHPVQVESVAWISERKNLLSTLFFLLALLAYLRWSVAPRARTYALVLLLFLGALLSKVNTIVLPAITLAYEIIVQRRLRRRDAAAAFGMLLCGAAVAWANLQGNPSHGAAYHGGSLAVTLRTSATVIPMYLVNALAPLSLSTYYAVPLRASWLHPTVVVAVIIIVVLAMLVLWGAWRGRADAFWLAWFGITLSPMLNLVPFPALMADRYLYVPLLGLLVPLLHLAEALLRRLGALRAAPTLVAVAVAGLGTLTMLRVPVFHDELSLWSDFALKMPYITSDEPYGPRPRPNEIRILSAAVARHPERAVLHNNLGGIAFEENRLADAVAFLVRAHELDPNDPAIALNLGRAYLRSGRIDDAERALQAAAALEPPSFYAQLNLARIYFLRRDLARARATLDLAKTLRPQSPAWRTLEQRLDQAAHGPA